MPNLLKEKNGSKLILNLQNEILKIFSDSSALISDSSILSKEIENSVNIIVKSLSKGNKLLILGNGGSAADAQHIASEFIGRFQKNRSSFPAISLSTDSSILTSISNDYNFDQIFKRQLEGLLNSGDVVLVLSTSGNSINIINALKFAQKKNVAIIGLLGNKGGKIKKFTDISLVVNSSSTARIQEVHRIIYHIICEIAEKKLAGIIKN
tara:strand:- start:759 stop:1385 length:627 start_codon:yes stop_codon:yes gene_type:complete